VKFKKIFFWLGISLLFLGLGQTMVLAKALTGAEIIKKVDANQVYSTAYFEYEMRIHVGEEIRTKKLVSYMQGREKSFAEFVYPVRDKGVKYLFVGDNLWMYLPSVEKVIKIAGHMLRQSMAGSDMSYEDALEDRGLINKYEIKLAGEEKVDGRLCYVLELVAKVKKVTYYKRKLWVDKELFLPLQAELFAKSGKKLKIMKMGKIKKFGKRYVAMYMTMQDLLKRDSLTEVIINKVKFDLKIPEGIFSRRNLMK
jgi:outer membrane lipoprotein-sorting protein